MKTRRVFHVLPADEPFSESCGGAVSRVVANLVRPDAESVIICPSADETWGFSARQIRESWFLRCYAKSSILRRFLLKAKPLLRLLLGTLVKEATTGDVVWIHGSLGYALLLAGVSTKRGFKLVLHMHNQTGWKPEMASALREVRVVFVSQALADAALENCPDLAQVEVLLNGANPSVYFPRPQSELKADGRNTEILFVGRLIAEKGVHVLVDAMRLLYRRSAPVHARIVGSVGFAAGGTSSYLENLITDAPENVVFEGYKSGAEVAEAYREADLFCCPSAWWEPFGLVLVEAMATGIPIVATNVGGIPEVLVEGGGILVAPDDPVALADALESLAVNSDLRMRMGKEALSSFRRNFSWQMVRERYRMIFGTL
jgi:spore coat protein SA